MSSDADIRDRGYSCTAVPGNTCVATASTTTVVAQSYCSGNLKPVTAKTFPDAVTITSTNSNGAEFTGVATRTMQMFAPMFQLNFQSTDIQTTASTTSAADTSESSSSTPTADSTSDGGLSSGAKIGIGVGVGVGALILIGALAWFLMSRRRSKRPPVAELGGSPAVYGPQGTVEHKPASNPGHHSVFSELSGETEPSELPAQRYM